MNCRAIQPSCVSFAAALLGSLCQARAIAQACERCAFGRSSEKLDADQLQLVLEDIDEAVAALEAAEDRANPKTCEKRTAEAQSQSWSAAGAFAAYRRNPDAR